jgi:flagellar protein FliO/FliZ
MLTYILKLIFLVPLVGGMAFLALYLWRKVQPGMAAGAKDRAVKVVDAIPLGTTGRLAVVEFGGKHLLLAVSRGTVQLLSESAAEPKSFAAALDRAEIAVHG